MNSVAVDVETQEAIFLFTLFVLCAQMSVRGIALLVFN